MLEDTIHGLESYYFNKHIVPDVLQRPFLDSNTSRGYQAVPNVAGVIKERIIYSFDYIISGLEEKLQVNDDLTREVFDEIHKKQVEDLRIYLNMRTDGAQLAPRAKGDFYGFSYNSYAKVIDLANKFWFYEEYLTGAKSKFAAMMPALRHVLHVPADEFLLNNLKRISTEYELEPFTYTNGGMSTLKSLEKYETVQLYVRAIVDAIPSKKFPGETTSPLVLDTYYAQANKE
ncbi:hypothetical protein BH11PLA2_BH11PLA2_47790 [soil metagenome]